MSTSDQTKAVLLKIISTLNKALDEHSTEDLEAISNHCKRVRLPNRSSKGDAGIANLCRAIGLTADAHVKQRQAKAARR